MALQNESLVALPLARNELSLLIELVNARIMEADQAGVSRKETSSVFREQLFLKLLDARIAHTPGDADADEAPLPCPTPGPHDE